MDSRTDSGLQTTRAIEPSGTAPPGEHAVVLRLSPDNLYTPCKPETLPSLDDVSAETDHEPPGQERAVEALEFGIGIHRKGYNIYVLGPAGAGRHSLTLSRLRAQAKTEPAPDDWCYVNNFADPRRPVAIRLPPGRAGVLRNAMRHLVDDLVAALPNAFERDEYRGRREALEQEFSSKRQDAFEALGKKAESMNAALAPTPMGITIVPIRNGKPIPTEAFQRLPEAEQERIRGVLTTLREELEQILHQIPDWERAHRRAVRQLNRETAGRVVDGAMAEVRNQFPDQPAVLEYLAAVNDDVRDHIDEFLAVGKSGTERSNNRTNFALDDAEMGIFRRYMVNVVIQHGGAAGAPAIYEDHPTYQRLIGRIEHIAHQGTLLTDFGLIVPGALHQANGGYLVLDAERLLTNPFIWDALKRTLRAEQLRIESIEQLLSIAGTISLEPQAIPLNVTIVLIGPSMIYHLLCALDPDFPALFKIAAEFEPDILREPGLEGRYARMLAAAARRDNLLPLDRSGAARIIEHAARLAGNAHRLSTDVSTSIDLLQEADFLARRNNAAIISAADVQAAIDARIRRADRISQRLRDETARRVLRIETSGEAVGQINGLSVIELGGFMFGHPSRITAQVRVGRGEVVDIERAVKLGGPIHSKGMLILTGFLGGRFGQAGVLSLSASVVFEQSYSHVEGDSASAAELLTLLSALAEVPLHQSLAVTGSVDQHGQIQAVGGVNEKIEGFFDVCRAQGLSKQQGVVIPAATVEQLMLREDVIAAVRAGEFHIYAIDTIDQAMELLSGLPAGKPDDSGEFPEGSFNWMAASRLAHFAKLAAPRNNELAPPAVQEGNGGENGRR